MLFIFGIIIWILFLKSGVHPTIAGILIAFAVPIRQRIDEFKYAEKLKDIIHRLTKSINTNNLPLLTKKQIAEIDNLEDWTIKVQSPLQQLEHRLHNWVAFLIMPVFQGIFGYLMVRLGLWVYNKLSPRIGGFEFEIEELKS